MAVGNASKTPKLEKRDKNREETKGIVADRLSDFLDKTSGQYKMTAAELAEKANISVGIISGYRNGNNAPSIAHLAAICRALDISADYLLDLSDIAQRDENVQIACKTTKLKPHTINSIRRLTRKGENDDGTTEWACIFPMYNVLSDIIEHKDFHLAMKELYQLSNSILRNETSYVLSDGLTRAPELEAIGHFIKGKDVKRMYAVYAKEHITSAVQAFINKFIDE